MGILASVSLRKVLSMRMRNALIRNTLMLVLLQASAYVVPLVITPYLARVLGVEQYGLLGIASSIIANLMTVTNWGFGLSATREVARNTDDPLALRKIFWNTLAAKALLGLTTLIAVVVIMACLGFSSSLSWIILSGWLQVIGSVGGVGWFLLGVEAMPSMVPGALIGGLLVIPLTFVFVHGPSDTMIAVAIAGLGGIISAVITLCIAIHTRPLMPVDCTLSGAWRQLCDGWHIFLSTGAVMLYTQINVIMVGALAGPVQAGLFFGAQKLAGAVKSAIGPLGTATYPRVNSLVLERPDQAIRLAKHVLVIQGAITFGLFIVMLAGAPCLTLLFLGADYEGAVPAVRWLSATVFLVGLSNAFGTQFILPFGMQRSFMRIIVGAGMFNVAAIVPCSYYFGATGASISIVSTEFIVTAAMSLVIWQAGIFDERIVL